MRRVVGTLAFVHLVVCLGSGRLYVFQAVHEREEREIILFRAAGTWVPIVS